MDTNSRIEAIKQIEKNPIFKGESFNEVLQKRVNTLENGLYEMSEICNDIWDDLSTNDNLIFGKIAKSIILESQIQSIEFVRTKSNNHAEYSISH